MGTFVSCRAPMSTVARARQTSTPKATTARRQPPRLDSSKPPGLPAHARLANPIPDPRSPIPDPRSPLPDLAPRVCTARPDPNPAQHTNLRELRQQRHQIERRRPVHETDVEPPIVRFGARRERVPAAERTDSGSNTSASANASAPPAFGLNRMTVRTDVNAADAERRDACHAGAATPAAAANCASTPERPRAPARAGVARPHGRVPGLRPSSCAPCPT